MSQSLAMEDIRSSQKAKHSFNHVKAEWCSGYWEEKNGKVRAQERKARAGEKREKRTNVKHEKGERKAKSKRNSNTTPSSPS